MNVSSTLENVVRGLQASGLAAVLRDARKGIEKESLRIGQDGQISQRPHPPGLGSALTHPHITTDYAEALLEFRTPPLTDTQAMLDFLSALHVYTYQHLESELIWPASMPCFLGDDEEIAVADYGSSNIGRMKRVYRLGLGYRYGRAMQAIAGIHFNYSLPERFWPEYQALQGDTGDTRTFIDRIYFGALRNFHRWGWLTSFLYGASPAMCTSFAKLRGGHYQSLDDCTVYGRYATSLRMSDTGYKNKNQAGLAISYNSLAEYVASLTRAISTSNPDYEKIGVKVGDTYRQLNANILQIENEYYSLIRPKQITKSGEKPTTALRSRGVQYIEVRALDVNPFDPVGVHASQLRLVETLLLLCLFAESPPFTDTSRSDVEHNQTQVACCGRDPDLMLNDAGALRRVDAWAREIIERMIPLAELLDAGEPEKPYISSLALALDTVRSPELLPSTRILRELRETGAGYWLHSLDLARRHAVYFSAQTLPPALQRDLVVAAAESLQVQKRLEEADRLSFDSYLAGYFAG